MHAEELIHQIFVLVVNTHSAFFNAKLLTNHMFQLQYNTHAILVQCTIVRHELMNLIVHFTCI